jgi:integrase
MSIRLANERGGSWEVDIRLRLPDGRRHRDRKILSGISKSAAQRWAEDRQRHLLQHGPEQTKKEVPTLENFAPRFLDGYARANKQKPSGVAAKEMILRVHLIPAFGHKRLNAISNEDVQRLKLAMAAKAPKTINNVLTVLNVLLKQAVVWGLLDRVPCSARLLPVPKPTTRFYDVEEFDRLADAAGQIDSETLLIVLLGGQAGLRCGEIIALEWSDIDFAKPQLCIRQSDWNGQVSTPKSGKLRYVPLTLRLAAALKQHRHLRSARVLTTPDRKVWTRQLVQYRMKRAARKAGLPDHGVHALRHSFCSHLSMLGAPVNSIRELAGHSELSVTQRYMHLSPSALDSAIGLLEQRGEIGEPARGGTGKR